MIRRHVTPSLIISLLALFIATSGASYAALQIPRNSVGAKQLQANAVTTKKVKDGTLLAKDFKAGQLPSGATGPAGPTGATGATGSDATVPAFRAQQAGTLALISNFQPVLSISLAPGNYVIMSRVNIYMSGPSNATALCSIGEDAAQAITVPLSGGLAVAQTTTVELAAADTVTLHCLKTGPATISAQQGSITALRVSSITGP